MAFAQQDVAETRRIFNQNLEYEQALGDQSGIAFSLHMLANVYDVEGDIDKVREFHKKSIALSREINAIWVLALAQFSLGYSEQAQGNLALAEELYEESLNHSRRLGEKWAMHMVLSNLGFMMCSKGDVVEAKKIFLEALDLSKELGNKDGMSTVLIGIAGVLETKGENIASARLQGAAVSMAREIGFELSTASVEQEFFDSTAKALKVSMGEETYQAEFETGMALTLDETVSLASGQN
jgi:tetratricopeptide (TPR) repeat protein